MDDMALAIVGTQIIVSDETHLKIYSGAPDSTDPCGQWYIDPDPNARHRAGYVPIRQRLSGCLAHIREENASERLTAARMP